MIKIVPHVPFAAAWPDAHEAAAFSRAKRRAVNQHRRRCALIDAQGEVRPLEDIEREVIRFAISHYRGQMSEVARRLQIGRSTLYRKLESLGLEETPRSRRRKNAPAKW